MKSRSKNLMEQQKLDLETTINQAFNDTKGAYTLFEAAKNTKDARLTSFNNSKDRFDEGIIDSFNSVSYTHLTLPTNREV